MGLLGRRVRWKTLEVLRFIALGVFFSGFRILGSWGMGFRV